jgi:hypothetical protein
MRRRIWIAAGIAALAAAAGSALWLGGPGRAGVAVIGDAAPAILAAAGWSQALPLHTAALTVVSVEGWEKLPFIADMAALCGAACGGSEALVRVIELAPGGTRKVVFVNLAAWPRAGDAPDFGCLAAALAEERRRSRGAMMPDCAGAVPVGRTRWALPFGLGLV